MSKNKSLVTVSSFYKKNVIAKMWVIDRISYSFFIEKEPKYVSDWWGRIFVCPNFIGFNTGSGRQIPLGLFLLALRTSRLDVVIKFWRIPYSHGKSCPNYLPLYFYFYSKLLHNFIMHKWTKFRAISFGVFFSVSVGCDLPFFFRWQKHNKFITQQKQKKSLSYSPWIYAENFFAPSLIINNYIYYCVMISYSYLEGIYFPDVTSKNN